MNHPATSEFGFKGGFVSRDDGLQRGTFVFSSLTQKAADENRRSQKPPAV
jgi:hypothetical protein